MLEQSGKSVKELLREAAAKLRAVGVDSPILDAELMLSHASKRARTELLTYPESQPPAEVVRLFRQWVQRRAKREPLPYILGRKEFYGISFTVNPAVLIPRPETEFLVDAVIPILRSLLVTRESGAPPLPSVGERDKFPPPTTHDPRLTTGLSEGAALHRLTARDSRLTTTCIDIGIGSGAIAVSLARNVPGVTVYGTDISSAAVRTATDNAERADVLESVRFREGDLFEPFPDIRFDAIVSNPPYIPTHLLESLQPEVRDYEPRGALNGGPDGLDIYRRLVPEAILHLSANGVLAVEVGIGASQKVQEFFRANGFKEVRSIRDYSGVERVVIGQAGA